MSVVSEDLMVIFSAQNLINTPLGRSELDNNTAAHVNFAELLAMREASNLHAQPVPQNLQAANLSPVIWTNPDLHVPSDAEPEADTNLLVTPDQPAHLQPDDPDQMAYTNDVLIGDIAIAFQSRAVVGPASFRPHLQEPVQLATLYQSRIEFEPPKLPHSGDRLDWLKPELLVSLADQSVQHIPTVELHTGSAIQPAMMVWTPTPIATARPSLTQGFSAPSVSIQVPIARAETGKPAATKNAAPANPPPSTSNLSPPFAQLVASQSEYRVVIRKQILTEAESEKINQSIGALVAKLGLPPHPIQFINAGGER